MSTPRNEFQPLSLEIEAPDAADFLHAQDYWSVNLHEPWEITFWAREFGCSEEELRRAVQRVGARAGDVRTHLGGERRQPRS